MFGDLHVGWSEGAEGEEKVNLGWELEAGIASFLDLLRRLTHSKSLEITE